MANAYNDCFLCVSRLVNVSTWDESMLKLKCLLVYSFWFFTVRRSWYGRYFLLQEHVLTVFMTLFHKTYRQDYFILGKKIVIRVIASILSTILYYKRWCDVDYWLSKSRVFYKEVPTNVNLRKKGYKLQDNALD